MEAQRTRDGKLRDRAGFTLIEIMVVIVILGLLAALVVPKLIGRTEEAKKTQARVQIRSVEQALELFKLDNGFFPTTEQGLEALVRMPESGRTPKNYRKGGYLDRLPKDPWAAGHPGLRGHLVRALQEARADPGPARGRVCRQAEDRQAQYR